MTHVTHPIFVTHLTHDPSTHSLLCVISLLSYALFTGSWSLNASNTSSSHLPTKFSQLPNPPYIHKLISTQRPRSTRSSSVVTLARPPSSSSLKITDHSSCYASPCLWNHLPLSLRKPHSGTSSSISRSPIPSPITSSSSDSPLCTSITPSLFHSRLKTYLFRKSYPLVSLLPPGLPSRTFACTVSSELLGFLFYFFLIFRFWAVR